MGNPVKFYGLKIRTPEGIRTPEKDVRLPIPRAPRHVPRLYPHSRLVSTRGRSLFRDSPMPGMLSLIQDRQQTLLLERAITSFNTWLDTI